MTTRLSIRSLAGTVRTLVAVGTDRLDSMLITVRAAAPRSGWISSSLTGPVGTTAGTSRGLGVVWEASIVFAVGWLAGAAGTGAGAAGAVAGAAGTVAGTAAEGAALAETGGIPAPLALPLPVSAGW